MDRERTQPDSRRMIRRILIAAGLLLLVVVGAFAAVIAFNAPTAPPVLAAGNTIPGMRNGTLPSCPSRRASRRVTEHPSTIASIPAGRSRGRAGARLSGTDVSMLKLAQALQAAGATVYAISLRGHGGSGTANGDVSYSASSTTILPTSSKVCGLDKPRHASHARRLSPPAAASCCASPAARQAGLFDDYLAISPYIGQDSPTNKPNAGGWAGVAVPRIIALSLLDGIGLPWFQGLPAVHFATDAKASNSRTPVYSFRLAASLQLGRDWRGVLARIAAPTEIVVGVNDELFNADQFKPMLQTINPRIGVRSCRTRRISA